MQDEILTETLSSTDEETQLPKNWQLVNLGELCEVVRGSSPRPQGDKRYYGGNVPRLMVADLTRDGMYVTPKIDFLTEEGAKLSRPMKKGEVVIAVSGNPGLPAILAVDACIHDGFVGLRHLDENRVDTKFLYYLLWITKDEQSANATGAIFRNLTTDQVRAIKIPLPLVIEEQRRIASVLDEQMKAVEQARLAVEEQLKAANLLLNAFLRSVFESEVAQNWRMHSLESVVENAQAGFAVGERDAKGAIQLRMNNVTTQGTFDWTSFIRVPIDEKNLEFYKLCSGDVLFNNTNSTELVGKTALFQDCEEPVVFSNHFTRIRAKTDQLEPNFLTWWLISKWHQKLFAEICDRWIGQSAVQRKKLLALEIPIPPIEEQRQIAERLNGQMQAAEILKQSLTEKLEAVKKLPAALLRKAFAGEI